MASPSDARSRAWMILCSALLLTAPGVSAQWDKPPRPTIAAPLEPAPVVPERKQPGAFARCRSKAQGDEMILDEAQRRVHQTVCGAALWFDGLFGEKGDVVAARSTYGRIELSHEFSEFYGNKTRLRFHARVQLPQLERRLSAFVGRDDEDDFVRDRSEGQALRSRTRRPTDQDSFLAGLGFAGITTERFQSDFKIGVRNPRLPKVFVQNRFSFLPYSTAHSRVYLRTTPFWNNRDGFGITQGLDADRVLGEDFLVRWSNVGTRTEETEGLDWRSALILYQNLKGESALAYELFVRGLTGAPEPTAEYGARTLYRQPLFRGRLYGEVILGYSWPREDPTLPRDGAVLAGIGLEMPFGRAPD